MKKTKFYGLLAVSLLSLQAQAQQDTSFTFYNYNMNIINPAYVGIGENIEFTSTVRSQWIGIDGAPEVQSFSLSFPVSTKVGIGMSVTNSNVFVLHETDITLDFSYKVQLNEKLNLFLGLKALGGSIIDIDLANLGVINDPLFTENVTAFNPNLGLGGLLKAENFYVNLSIPNFLTSTRYERDSGVVTEVTDNLLLFAGAGYHIPLGNGDVVFTPSFLARMVAGVPFSADINGMFNLYDKVDVGVSHRLRESISGLAYFKMLDWIKLGYGYDAITSDLANYAKGNHEVLLKILL